MQKYGELLGTLLKKRGIRTEAEAEIFLKPDYRRDLYDPYLMRDMERACVRLYEAVENKEKIIIYADYDCDGIPGAVILEDLFRLVSFKNFEVYIPKRNIEGYGLNVEAVKQFAESGAKLLITIDLGITAIAEVAQAEVDGMDVIITDHHLPPEVLPKAYAILNPKTDEYPEKMLAGAGVMFKFAQAFVKKYGEYFKIKDDAEKWMLDMAGLATLADMVPLLGENRALAYFGLKVLRRSPRPGLQKLLANLGIDQKYLSEDDVTFSITPRLNAASRMDDPRRAYELLTTLDEGRAGVLAEHLSRINDERKAMVAGIMREVKKNFEKREMREIIVVGNPKWRVGVLGLVAGKISDEYARPVFVWGKDESDSIRGSCRSDGSVSVVELMTETREYFIEYGGHELAGGFSVHTDKIHFLEEALASNFSKVRRNTNLNTNINYDIKSDLGVVTMKTWDEIQKLAPYGLGNPKPVFLFEKVKVENIKKFGKNGGEHLEISFIDSLGNKAKAVSFFSHGDSFTGPVGVGFYVNLLANLDLSRYRGREELRLRVVDII
ncbi:MAG: single-stranded-DNA-specific exonuclease RecJ [Patescibacteria group bacterium]